MVDRPNDIDNPMVVPRKDFTEILRIAGNALQTHIGRDAMIAMVVEQSIAKVAPPEPEVDPVPPEIPQPWPASQLAGMSDQLEDPED